MSGFRYFEAPNYWAPADDDPPGVFLAGGITGCPRWHDDAVATLRASGVPMVVLNPNRSDFPIHDPDAGEQQVRWEQHHLKLPSTVTMLWFPAPLEPNVVQPIAQFEYGQAIDTRTERLVVGADPGYPRVRDVHLMMKVNHPGVIVHSTLDDVLAATVEVVRGRSVLAELDRLRVEVGEKDALIQRKDDLIAELRRQYVGLERTFKNYQIQHRSED